MIKRKAAIADVPDRPDAGDVYSNCDHELDESVAAKLETGNFTGNHIAWNFFGYVWKDENKWCEAVFSFHQLVETISAKSLIEVIQKANERHGGD